MATGCPATIALPAGTSTVMPGVPVAGRSVRHPAPPIAEPPRGTRENTPTVPDVRPGRCYAPGKVMRHRRCRGVRGRRAATIAPRSTVIIVEACRCRVQPPQSPHLLRTAVQDHRTNCPHQAGPWLSTRRNTQSVFAAVHARIQRGRPSIRHPSRWSLAHRPAPRYPTVHLSTVMAPDQPFAV